MRNREPTRGTRAEARTSGDLVCFSHLRWGFAYRRPQHLMARFARDRRVFFVEEPTFEARDAAHLRTRRVEDGLYVCAPHLPRGLPPIAALAAQRALVDGLVKEHAIRPEVLWIDTPAALDVAGHLGGARVAYDCPDDLEALGPDAARLHELERRVLARAHVVFTGTQSLYEAKLRHHANVHVFPSGVDARHFRRAREVQVEPDDQFAIPRPRAGSFGVIDAQLDLELVARLADARPRLQLVFLGAVRGLDPASLPRRPNLHWLGPKRYAELPAYLAGWDVALLPLARNDGMRATGPMRTLEYLAAGLPIASTPVRDAVSPYDDLGLVRVAHVQPIDVSSPDGRAFDPRTADARAFARAVDAARTSDREVHRANAEAVVARTSWDVSWRAMDQLLFPEPARPDRDRAPPGSAPERGLPRHGSSEPR